MKLRIITGKQESGSKGGVRDVKCGTDDERSGPICGAEGMRGERSRAEVWNRDV